MEDETVAIAEMAEKEKLTLPEEFYFSWKLTIEESKFRQAL